MDSLRYITAREGWFMNLVMCALCSIIPVIGQIVLMGYMFEVFDSLHRDPEKKSYPLFDFGKFVPYLTRGVWPFVVQILTGIAIAIPLAILYAIMMAIAVAAKNGIMVGLVWIVLVLTSFALGILIAVFTWPMMTYAGVAQKLDIGGMVSYSRSLVSKAFKELLLSLIFAAFAGWLLGIVGIFACCIGVYVAAVAAQLMVYHLKVQIYELYLERGGTPIPTPEPPPRP
jgi:hypothetical protein